MDDVISAHKPRLLDVATQPKRSAHAALGLATSCVQFLIPVAGQQTQGTTFWTLKITTQVASPGAESAVYNCLAEVCVEHCTLALDMTLPAAAAPVPAERLISGVTALAAACWQWKQIQIEWQPLSTAQRDRQIYGRTPDRYTDCALHTTWAMSIR